MTTKKKKKINFSSVVVILVLILNLWFTNRVLDIYEAVGNEPMVLIGAFFSFTGVELWSLAQIKKAKIKKEEEPCDE